MICRGINLAKKWKYIVGILLLAAAIWLEQSVGKMLLEGRTAESSTDVQRITVVLDPGHGSSDPGKVGVDGCLEKEINLQIALKVKSLLVSKGIEVEMTRIDDEGMAGSKVEDLKSRVDLINRVKPALAVSIHQNSYTQENVDGAQTFYFAHSENGEEAALILQEKLCEVDGDNHRQAKANDTYYLLKKTKVPTVIVECGFLSNAEEAKKLQQDDYQMRMAEAVCEGICAFIQKEE